MGEQCSRSRYMQYNCCQLQPDICPKNKICQPVVSLEKPWKRFNCSDCSPGYHGDNCEKRIRSCQGYSNGSRTSGVYKVLDSAGSLYEVYCHFDPDGAWTLLQSYSFANRSLVAFKQPLYENSPHGENALSWKAYRLSHARMTSIKQDYAFIRFTCEFEKFSDRDIENSDYLQVKREDFSPMFDVFSYVIDMEYIWPLAWGKIGNQHLIDKCEIRLHQSAYVPLHAHVLYDYFTCELSPSSKDDNCTGDYNFFGELYWGCRDKNHRCVSNDNSTTQLWVGHA